MTLIAMPCNTAHLYFDELQGQIGVPILNIVEETLSRLPKVSRVALFATKATVDCEIYQRGFTRVGCEHLRDEQWQHRVTTIIGAIKSRQRDLAAHEWCALVQEVAQAGAEAIVSGCTDLNVIADTQKSKIPLIDSTRALAEATVASYLRLRGPVK